MGTIMALDISMGKSYKVVYDGQNCLSEGEIIHNQVGFQKLMIVILSLPEDLMIIFESTGIYSKPIETFCLKNKLRYCLSGEIQKEERSYTSLSGT